MLTFANTGSFVKISSFGQNYGYKQGEYQYNPPQAPFETHYKRSPQGSNEVSALPDSSSTSQTYGYGYEEPSYGYNEPNYGYNEPGYGYEEPQYNCTIIDVTETADVCTPGAIHKLHCQDFVNFLYPFPLALVDEFTIISYCSIIDIWLVPPPCDNVVCEWP